MGNFIHVYPDQLTVISALLGAGHATNRERIIAANQDLLELNPGDWDEDLAALDQLLDGLALKFAGEHPDGPALIYAFHFICRSTGATGYEAEIYLDPDLSPEIWDFVWGADPTPFELPMSPSGTPAVVHWPAKELERQLKALRALDFEALRATLHSDYREDIGEICGVLESAKASGMGVFVFYFE